MADTDLVAKLKGNDLDTVVLAFPDHNGRLMGKRLTVEYFLGLGENPEIHASLRSQTKRDVSPRQEASGGSFSHTIPRIMSL